VKARWMLLATLVALMVGMVALASAAWAAPGPPTVLYSYPQEVNGSAVDLPRDLTAQVKFSEAMRAGSINNNTIYITAGCGLLCGPEPAPKVPATVTYNSSTHVAKVNPNGVLQADLQHALIIEGANDSDTLAVKDTNGEALAQSIVERFTPRDGVSGGVVTTDPIDEATGVSVSANIKARFAEAMKAGSFNTDTFHLVEGDCDPLCDEMPKIPAAVKYNSTNKTAVLNPTSDLAPNTTYTATVEGVQDLDPFTVRDRDDNPLFRDHPFLFTTGSGCDVC
jgi:hypothetical protein